MYKGKLAPVHAAIDLEPDKEVTSRVVDTCLIGKIILEWPVDKRDVKSIASFQWKCKKDFSVSYVGRNTFMFSFQGKEDWSKVLLHAPCNIKGGLLILSPFISGKMPEELQFSFSPFWVQVHGLPMDYLTKANGLKLGQLLGKFPYDVFDGKALDRKFLRIRVILDITKPLFCGFWVRRSGLSDIWVEFKYEKLGIFCYKCGRIGNHYRSCQFPAKKAKFEPWLQAEPPSGSLAVASLTSSSYVPGRATVAAARDTNACTALITVASSLEPEIHQEMESEHMYHGSNADISARNLKRKLIVNSRDSLVMVANCAMISSRPADVSA